MTKPKVVLVTTGGTIASSVDASGNWTLRHGSALVADVPAVESIAQLEVDDLYRQASSRLSLEQLMGLVTRVREHASRSDIAGVVVTHGTDSLEESAYLLDLLVEPGMPVVITGAMRNITEPGADGPRNLYAAVLTTLHPHARGQGALVVLNDTVHAAREVTKLDTRNPASFGSPVFGPLAYVEGDRVIWGRLRVSVARYPHVDQLESRVQLVKLATGMDGTLIEAAVARGTRAVVLETLGAGAIPPAALAAAQKAARSGLPVIAASRCVSGTVGVPGRGNGLITAGDLSGPKARLLSMVLLAADLGPRQLRAAFSQPGEYQPGRD